MTPIKFVKKRMPIACIFLMILLILSGCNFKSNHFGVIYITNKDIYRIPDNTQSDVEQLTFTPSIGEYQLLVSENGDKIIFKAGFGETEPESSEKRNHVYLLDTESKDFIDITNVLVEYSQVWDTFRMDWLPAQEQFMVVKYTGQEYDIESYLEFIDFDGKHREQFPIETISEIPALIQTAELSPDGKKVVLTQGVIGLENQIEYPGSAILVYAIESQEVTQLTDYEDHCLPRGWSPTSQKIAVTCYYKSLPYVAGPSTIKILDVENLEQPVSLFGFSPCDDPSWSPDGKQIAFLCKKNNGRDGLFIMNTENYEINEIMLDNPVILRSPTWSPDGISVIYAAGPDLERLKIYSIQSDGSNKHSLTSEEGAYSIVSVYPVP